MAWNGDISKMGQLAANIGKLASVPARASKRVAKEIKSLIQEEFREQADPYGNAWRPHMALTTYRHGMHPILDLTGQMKESLDVRPRAGAGISITIDHPSEDHQTGWDGPQGSGPARPILPSNRFPARWKEVIDAAVRDTAKKTLRGEE